MTSRDQGPPNEFSREEDSTEIEVIPAKPAPQPRRPRTPNPAVDDVIQSGEIVQRRSMVIKSSASAPQIEVHEEQTIPTQLTPHVEATGRRSKALWLVAALAPALAAAVLTVAMPAPPGPGKPATTDVQTAADIVGTLLDGEARAALLRAQAIASSSMLRAAIETDPQTLADMTRDKDLVFPVDHGESLEIFQLNKGARRSMLRLPPTAPPIPPGAVETRIEAHDDGIAVVAIAAIATQQSGISGEVTISVPVNLDQVKTRVAEHVNRASLIGLPKPVVLVRDMGKGGVDVTLPIDAKVTKTTPMTIFASVTAVAGSNNRSALKKARYACLGLTGLLLVMFGGSLAIKRS